ncbi:MAG TPA: hypothetical protein DER33_00015 [Syntrophomonas sp.]|jgi:hypothetical protein|nr:hypothetical protein [Syntrophomonas sp.]HCF69973.1 hypothetical protein [Syntrophomonas sp.]
MDGEETNIDNVITQELNSDVLPPKKRRVLPWVLAVLVLALLGGGGYYYWTTTPEYSLKMIAKAIKQHDLPTFEKYVDIESVSTRAVDQLCEVAINDPEEIQNELADGLIEMFKPQLVKVVNKEVKSFVEKGSVETDASQDKEDPVVVKDLLNKAKDQSMQVVGTKYVKKEGNIAIVGLEIKVPGYDKNLVADLKMRDMGNYWQLAELSNLGDVINESKRLEKAKLDKLNQPIVEKIDKALALGSVTLIRNSDDWGWDDSITFSADAHLNGTVAVNEIQAQLNVKAIEGGLLLNEDLVFQGNWTPGTSIPLTWSKEINPFIDSDQLLFETPTEQLSIDIQPQLIKFADGSELKLLDELP